jgi:hypothetical protein
MPFEETSPDIQAVRPLLTRFQSQRSSQSQYRSQSQRSPRGTEKKLRIEPARIAELTAYDGLLFHVVQKVMETVAEAATAAEQTETCDCLRLQSLSEMGSELVASVILLINHGDSRGADRLISIIEGIEGRETSPFTDFLRGEYFYVKDMFTDAEFHYKISISKDDAFWPAFYRICSLAAGGSQVLYKHRIIHALESINRGRDLHYEAFIGGFSPDYYQGALMKQIEIEGDV